MQIAPDSPVLDQRLVKNSFGLPRLREILEAHMWPGLSLKDHKDSGTSEFGCLPTVFAIFVWRKLCSSHIMSSSVLHHFYFVVFRVKSSEFLLRKQHTLLRIEELTSGQPSSNLGKSDRKFGVNGPVQE